jgi:predicted SAM-dependent methyltransferase
MTRRLHIGGWTRVDGWEVLSAEPGECVDHVGNANDLSRFSDETFFEIYASHVLEHLDYTGEIQHGLKEWHRVLQRGGRVSISVPDLEVLASMYIAKDRYSAADRFMIMRMIFGGHVDKHDYHVIGLDEPFLAGYLLDAGFSNPTRVDDLGLFHDTSAMKFKGVAISLNMTATKP